MENKGSRHTAWKIYVSKMKGVGKSPLKIDVKDALTGLVGSFLTIFILILLTNLTDTEWLMAPFGASCVLTFVVWNSPLSQPRNVIGGHVLSTFVGICMYQWLGSTPLAMSLAVGLAIFLMVMTKTIHPPAGGDAIVIMFGGYSWHYLVSPVLLGSIVIVVMALIINNLRQNRSYPTFWI